MDDDLTIDGADLMEELRRGAREQHDEGLTIDGPALLELLARPATRWSPPTPAGSSGSVRLRSAGQKIWGIPALVGLAALLAAAGLVVAAYGLRQSSDLDPGDSTAGMVEES